LALALALALPSRPAAVNEDEVKVTRARFLFEPVHEVIEAVEEPAAPAAAPAPVSRAKPSAGRKAPPARGDLLSTFASKGVSEALNKNLGSGTELTHIAGQASGHSGEAEEAGGPGLKSTGSGAEGQTYTIAGGGRSGRTGYSHAGGLAPRGRAEIQIAGSDGAFSGGMDREGIRRVIREHLPEIRNCYERELQSQPDLYGKVVLEWDIEAGGRVGKAAVKTDSLSNPKVGQCLTAHLRNWNFPEPPANTVGRVSYPFVFSAQ
jgi:Ca-activated chloride channel family protein